MKIQHLSIENYRGIKKLSLDLTAPVAVFVGKNGAGKSSILDCLATLLSWYPARIRSPKESGSRLRQTDIQIGRKVASARIVTDFEEDRKIEWSLSTARKGCGQSSQSQLKELTEEAQRQVVQMFSDPVESVADSLEDKAPLIVHYDVNRAVLDIPLRIRGEIDLGDPLIAFDGALGAGVNFRSFFSWYRQREDLENEKMQEFLWIPSLSELAKSKLTNLIESIQDHQLEVVRQAIEVFTGFTGLKVRRNPLHMELKKNGKTLWVDHLSDGEKCLLAMVGDLARRLASLSGKKAPLQGRGVVLIDEIELHLHPEWQREIIPKLIKTFPNCQFIVTTHSPQVISDVRPEYIFLLRQTEDNIVANHPEDAFGQTSDRILEDIMGVPARPQEIKKALRDLFYLISNDDLDAAKKQAQALQEKIGSDPDLVRANTLIRRKEVLDK